MKKVRSCIILMFCLLVVICATNVASSATKLLDLKEFTRIDFNNPKKHKKEMAINLFSSSDIRVWIFRDILDTRKYKTLLEDIQFLGVVFETNIYPRFKKMFDVFDDFKGVDILIDNMKCDNKYSGFYSPEYMGENIILLDVNYKKFGMNSLCSMLVHEFTHYVQYQLDDDEDSFINEGIALLFEYIMFQNPYDGIVTEFFKMPTNGLIDFKHEKSDYANAYLFFHYIYSSLGGLDIVIDIMKHKENGIEAIKQVLENKNIYFNNQKVDFEMLFGLYSAGLFMNSEELNVRSYLTKETILLPPYSASYRYIKSKDINNINRLKHDGLLSYYVGLSENGFKQLINREFSFFKNLVLILVNPTENAVEVRF